ncbi:hypothetical protein CDD83_10203 [Cordyceps sp. RAO-2017]|nr:hypothetical protein CDD83_10203 [Cordyceps sp. RAO-2017]
MSATAESEETNLQLRATDMRIILQIGERRFTTTRQTLVTESAFFASLLSDRWNNKLDDGSYFVDADPDLFEHILRYLRHLTYPIFYDDARGHNYGLYLAILSEARYFGITRLQKWLEEREYVNVVRLTRTFQTYEDSESAIEHYKTSPTDTTVEFHPSWGTKKVYTCPRSIPVHRGEPWACGRQCHNARGNEPIVYEDEPILRTLVVTTQVIVRQDQNALSLCCLAGNRQLVIPY